MKTRTNLQNTDSQHLHNKNLRNKTLREFSVMDHSNNLETLIITINNSSNDSSMNDEDVKNNYIFHQDKPKFDINTYLINSFNDDKELNKVSVNDILCAEIKNFSNNKNLSDDCIVSLSDNNDDITFSTTFNDEEMIHGDDGEEETEETSVSHQDCSSASSAESVDDNTENNIKKNSTRHFEQTRRSSVKYALTSILTLSVMKETFLKISDFQS